MKVWYMSTNDIYELPVTPMMDSAKELAEFVGTTENAIISAVSQKQRRNGDRCIYHCVEIGDLDKENIVEEHEGNFINAKHEAAYNEYLFCEDWLAKRKELTTGLSEEESHRHHIEIVCERSKMKTRFKKVKLELEIFEDFDKLLKKKKEAEDFLNTRKKYTKIETEQDRRAAEERQLKKKSAKLFLKNVNSFLNNEDDYNIYFITRYLNEEEN